MVTKKCHSFNWYFINKRLHPKAQKGFRQNLILLIVNKNKTQRQNNILLVQHNVKAWTLPKEGLKSEITVDDIFTTIARNLEEELGFRGLKITDLKPQFKQVALLFDFDKQIYDKERSEIEKRKQRPSKGKLYHLAILEYSGPDKIPFHKDGSNKETIDYKWIDYKKGREILQENIKLSKQGKLPSIKSSFYNLHLFDKVILVYRKIQKIGTIKIGPQDQLFS